MILFPGLIFCITHSPPMQCHIGVMEQQETVDDRIARVKGSARLLVPYLPLCQWSSWFFGFVNLSKGEENLFFLSLAPIPSPFTPSPPTRFHASRASCPLTTDTQV